MKRNLSKQENFKVQLFKVAILMTSEFWILRLMFGQDYELADHPLNHDLTTQWTYQAATSSCSEDGVRLKDQEKSMNLEMENASIS